MFFVFSFFVFSPKPEFFSYEASHRLFHNELRHSELVPETEPTQEDPVQDLGGRASMSLPLNCLRKSGPTAMTGPSPIA